MTARPNPPVVPADTSPEVWRRQMAAIGAKTVGQRIAEWEALNRAGAEMEEAAVRRRHPDYDDHDVHLALVRLRYGDALVRGAWPDEPLRDP
ncbi:MAG TPA: hypothetical protein VFU19_01465 [Iamia sp.]|nr:hypothetical protein [Iamia sp.]